MSIPRLRIKKREQQRLREGHLWVYSNEVDTDATPLKSIAGHLGHLDDYRGHFLATASFNAQSLICARILTAEPIEALNSDFFKAKIAAALHMREQQFSQPFYRLVFGEGDFLPGMVIDRFDQVFVIQISTQAVEQAKPALIDALHSLFDTQVKILFKNDG